MRIISVRGRGIGPLISVDWRPGPFDCVFDSNEAGKTSIIDLLISALFKRTRDYFATDGIVTYTTSRHLFEPEEGKVVIEMNGGEVEFAAGSGGKKLVDYLYRDIESVRRPDILSRLLVLRSSDAGLFLEKRGREVSGIATFLGEGADLDRIWKKVRENASLTEAGKETREAARKVSELTDRLGVLDEAEDRVIELERLENEIAALDLDIERISAEIGDLLKKEADLKDRLKAIEILTARERLRELDDAKRRIETARMDEDDLKLLKRSFRDAEAARAEAGRLSERLKDLDREEDELEDEITNLGASLLDLERKGVTTENELEKAEAEANERRGEWALKRGMIEEALRNHDAPVVSRAFATLGLGIFAVLVVSLAAIIPSLGFGIASLPSIAFLAFVLLSVASVLVYPPIVRRKRAEAVRTAAASAGLVSDDIREIRAFLETEEERRIGGIEKALSGRREERDRVLVEKERMDERRRLAEEKRDRNRMERKDLEKKIREARDSAGRAEEEVRRLKAKTGAESIEEGERIVRDLDAAKIEAKRLTSEIGRLLGTEGNFEERIEELEASLPADPASILDGEGGGDARDIRERLDLLSSTLGDLTARRDRLAAEREGLKTREADLISLLPRGDDEAPLKSPIVLARERSEIHSSLKDRAIEIIAARMIRRVMKEKKSDELGQIRLLLRDESETGPGTILSALTGDDRRIGMKDEGGIIFTLDDLDETELSSGVVEQIFFALRVSLAEALTPEDPPFFVLDDPFLRFDADRRRRAAALLGDLVEGGRQVILFTVDPMIRDLAAGEGARILSVGDLEGEEAR